MCTHPAIDSGTWNVVSTSHHTVRSNGWLWLKTARDDSAGAAAEIRREISLLATMDVPVTTVTHDGRVGHLTPTLGEPVTTAELGSATTPVILDHWARLTPSQGPSLPRPEDYVEIAKTKIIDRVTDPLLRNELVKTVTHAHLPEYAAAHDHGLCHTDPHAGNWLRDNKGLVLIDWETAIYAPVEVAIACLAWVFWLDGSHRQALNVIHRDRVDLDVIVATVLVKSATTAAWAHPKLGHHAALLRQDAGLDLAARIRHHSDPIHPEDSA